MYNSGACSFPTDAMHLHGVFEQQAVLREPQSIGDIDKSYRLI
jgi:hypothetical protein